MMILNVRIIIVKTSLVAGEFVYSSEYAHKLFMPLLERMRLNTVINKSLFQVPETSPVVFSDVTPPAVLSTLVLSLLEIQSQLA